MCHLIKKYLTFSIFCGMLFKVFGGVAERLKAQHWKCCDVKASVGSNPIPSSKNRQGSKESCRFYLLPIHYSIKWLVDFRKVICSSE